MPKAVSSKSNKSSSVSNDRIFLSGAYELSEGNPVGSIQIAPSAIASIIRQVVLDIDGVARFAGTSFLDNIAELVGSRKLLDRSISIHVKENEFVAEISIVVYFGVRIPLLVKEIQTLVAESMDRMTGLKLKSINVLVKSMEERPHADSEDNDSDKVTEQE